MDAIQIPEKNMSWQLISMSNEAGYPVIEDISDPKTLLSQLYEGVYDFAWKVNYENCGTFWDIVNIEVNSAPTIADAEEINGKPCQLDLEISANKPNNGIGKWSLISAPTVNAADKIIIDNPWLPKTHVWNITDLGEYIFRWTISSGEACSSSTSDLAITFSEFPPTVPNAGTDQFLCEGENIRLSAAPISIGSGVWKQVVGTKAKIAYPNSANTDILDLVDSLNTFVWEVTSGGCSISDSVNIINYHKPTKAEIIKDEIRLCHFESVELEGNEALTGKGQWSFISGPNTPLIKTPENNTTSVSGLLKGEYQFAWSISNGTCPQSIDTAVVSIEGYPNKDLFVSGDTVCYGEDATISVIDSEDFVEYEFIIGTNSLGVDVAQNDTLSFSFSSSELLSDTNYITISAKNSAGCKTFIDNQAVVLADIYPMKSDDSFSLSFCEGASVLITIQNTYSTYEYLIYINSQLVSTEMGNPDGVEVLVPKEILNFGNNQVEVKSRSILTNCQESWPNKSEVIVNPNPKTNLAIEGGTVCGNDDGIIKILASEENVSYDIYNSSYLVASIQGTGQDLDVAISKTYITLGDNFYNIIAETQEACIKELEEYSLIKKNIIPINSYQIDSSEFCAGDNARFRLSPTEPGFKYDLLIDDETVTSGTASLNNSNLLLEIPYEKFVLGENPITVKISSPESGCSVELDDHIELLIKRCKGIVVYNGFSPNKDGINETFTINGLINYPDHKVIIFDRWGNKVFEASPYMNDWSGKSKNGLQNRAEELPEGTYFYVIELGGEDKPVKGYLYLNR